MNQKEVPTGLIYEALTCWLSLLVSRFLCKMCGVNPNRRQNSHLTTMSRTLDTDRRGESCHTRVSVKELIYNLKQKS